MVGNDAGWTQISREQVPMFGSNVACGLDVSLFKSLFYFNCVLIACNSDVVMFSYFVAISSLLLVPFECDRINGLYIIASFIFLKCVIVNFMCY